MSISIFQAHRSLIVAAALIAVAVLGPVNVLAKEPSMAQRLQHLEDIEAIRALLEHYYEFQESRDFEAFANLFSKDGELILRRGRTGGGPAGIKAAFTRQPTGGNAANSAERDMRHILSNIKIVVTGDTATAMSRFTLLVPAEDNRTRVGGTGRYGDKLVRENGEWKFQQRILYRDIPIDTTGGAAPAK